MIKKFEEFEENKGYEMVDELFIFSILDVNDPYKEPEYADFGLIIQPKSYWDDKHCQYDQHVSFINGGVLNLPSEFEEVEESSFMYLGSDVEEAIEKLVILGIKFNQDFQIFMETSTTLGFSVNGLTLLDYMKQNFPSSIV